MTANVIEHRIPRLEEKVSAGQGKLDLTNQGCIHLDTRITNMEQRVAKMDENQFALAKDGLNNSGIENIMHQVNELRQRFDEFKNEVYAKAELNAKELAKVNEKLTQCGNYINHNSKNIANINQRLNNISAKKKSSNMENLKDLLSGCSKRGKSPIYDQNNK